MNHLNYPKIGINIKLTVQNDTSIQEEMDPIEDVIVFIGDEESENNTGKYNSNIYNHIFIPFIFKLLRS